MDRGIADIARADTGLIESGLASGGNGGIAQSPSGIISLFDKAFGALFGLTPIAETPTRFGSGIPGPWPGDDSG